MAATATLASADSIRASIACAHCGLPIEGEPVLGGFCCHGCKQARRLILAGGLERYYTLRDGRGIPVAGDEPHDLKWLSIALSPQLDRARKEIRVAVSGLTCAACVWLIQQVFARFEDAEGIVVNTARGELTLTFGQRFDAPTFFRELAALGYRAGPSRGETESRSLVTRMGVCIALALNAMLFAVSLYAGLGEGPLYELFHLLLFALATLSVLVGGPVFFRAAWAGLRRGLLHLELPISIGILLAYTGSAVAFLAGQWEHAYFDSVAAFIALMLVGRYLRARVVEASRAHIADQASLESLLVRRVKGDTVEVVSATVVERGDTLILSPGDVVPVKARCLEPMSLSREWINGEPDPRSVAEGHVASAGEALVGMRAGRVVAEEDFSASELLALLGKPDDVRASSQFWARLSAAYTGLVLVFSAGGIAAWLVAGAEPFQALRVGIAVLVVTCPCALGIATPLAYEWLQAGLRRAGVFIRRASLLDRLSGVKRIALDKTGTLTNTALAQEAARELASLDAADAHLLYNLALRSTHPKCVALRRALEEQGEAAYDAALCATEEVGRGLELQYDSSCYRLGAPGWAGEAYDDQALVFSRDEVTLMAISTVEKLRPGTEGVISAMLQRGIEVWILSGDAQSRVQAIASELGLPADRALGARTPRDKVEWIESGPAAETLLIGDGLNDAAALSVAGCSGTPAIERALVAARADFCFAGRGFGAVGKLMESADVLRRAIRRNVVFAVVYNTIAVGLALAGLMTPLMAAVLMPASSVVAIGMTFGFLRRNVSWT